MSTQQWFYSQNGSVYGPFTLDVLKQMADAGLISAATQVTIAGKEQWIPLADILSTSTEGDAATSQSTHLWGNIAGKIGSASGLEKLEGFSVGQLFSEVFRRHTPEQIEEHFSTGTKATTPPLNVVVASWPTPWAFFRLLGVSLGAAFGFYWALSRFQNPLLIPGWMFVGCFGIPFSALVFFLEANILRNVSVYRVMALLFLGGLLSLVFSLFLFEFTKLDQWIGAIGAGPIEELGKLLAVVFFTRRWHRHHWTLNGMLFGAAVGTGFSAFESAGYVFVSLASGGDFGAEATMALRAFLSPFTHTIWTSATAAALWRVKGDLPFRWAMLADPRFLRILVIIVVLHGLWNSPLSVPVLGGYTGYFAFRLILGVVGWIIILLLIQTGLKEIRTAQAKQTPDAV